MESRTRQTKKGNKISKPSTATAEAFPTNTEEATSKGKEDWSPKLMESVARKQKVAAPRGAAMAHKDVVAQIAEALPQKIAAPKGAAMAQKDVVAQIAEALPVGIKQPVVARIAEDWNGHPIGTKQQALAVQHREDKVVARIAEDRMTHPMGTKQQAVAVQQKEDVRRKQKAAPRQTVATVHQDGTARIAEDVVSGRKQQVAAAQPREDVGRNQKAVAAQGVVNALQAAQGMADALQERAAQITEDFGSKGKEQETLAAEVATGNITQLERDVKVLLHKLAPTRKSVAIAQKCLTELRTMLREFNDGWDVMPFGSSANGFNTVSSDLDATCCLAGFFPGKDAPQQAAYHLQFLLQKLDAHPAFSIKEQILHARVPILKLCFGSVLDVDLSCHNRQPLSNTHLLRAYSCIDQSVVDLVVAVKLWAKESGVCDAANSRLSSYAFTLLVLYFMQTDNQVRLPVLPVEDFDFYSITDKEERILSAKAWFKCDLTLAELLSRFFAFYSNHDSEGFAWGSEVVSLRMGLRSTANNTVFAKLRGRHESRLHIEDPYELERNLHGVLGKFEEEELRRAFAEAHYAIDAGKTPLGLKCRDSHQSSEHEALDFSSALIAGGKPKENLQSSAVSQVQETWNVSKSVKSMKGLIIDQRAKNTTDSTKSVSTMEANGLQQFAKSVGTIEAFGPQQFVSSDEKEFYEGSMGKFFWMMPMSQPSSQQLPHQTWPTNNSMPPSTISNPVKSTVPFIMATAPSQPRTSLQRPPGQWMAGYSQQGTAAQHPAANILQLLT